MKSQPLNMVSDQLDWPPERVPPLIELVLFFRHQPRMLSGETSFFIRPKSLLVASLKGKTQGSGWPSASAQLSVRSAGKMLYNLKASWYLARINPLKK